jgi:DNA-binding transcriptional LysR family regulator
MKLSHLDLSLLVSLDALLEESNVTRAAARLGLSQPALSAQLRQLREAFGDPLLVPHARGMTPTARGMALRHPLRDILGAVHGLVVADSHFDPASAQHTFRIAATDAIHSIVSAPLAARLATLAPHSRLAMLAPDLRTLPQRLAAGEIDVAVLTQQTVAPQLHARKLYDESFLCVMRIDHPVASAPLDLEIFCSLDHAMVSPAGGGFTGAVDDALAALGRNRRVQISLNSFLLLPDLVEKSDLIATIPARLARRWSTRLTVLSPPFELTGFSVSMGWHTRAHLDPAQVWLRNTLRATMDVQSET